MPIRAIYFRLAALITATLIVKNEAAHLLDCLASLSGVVSDIVVVDTGSSDGSKNIARASGAEVHDFPWVGDFSAARNFAIEQARGEWLLYIDADERVRPCDQAALMTALASPGLLAATVAFRPRTGFTAYEECRLFRRDPRIRFHGAMHETFKPDVEQLERAGLGTTGTSGLAIDHVGYDGDQSHKFERNLRLLLKQIAADPSRAYLRWHLGTVFQALGRVAEAEASWAAGIDIVRSQAHRLPGDVLCFIEVLKHRWSQGRPDPALLAEALGLQPGNWLLHWLDAKMLAAAGRYGAAIPIFERLAEIDAADLVGDVAYDARIFGAWASAEIGYCAFQEGRFAVSAEWYARAEQTQPSVPEFRVKRVLAEARR